MKIDDNIDDKNNYIIKIGTISSDIIPIFIQLVEVIGLEPMTSCL